LALPASFALDFRRKLGTWHAIAKTSNLPIRPKSAPITHQQACTTLTPPPSTKSWIAAALSSLVSLDHTGRNNRIMSGLPKNHDHLSKNQIKRGQCSPQQPPDSSPQA
jgi:hypothetical protein